MSNYSTISDNMRSVIMKGGLTLRADSHSIYKSIMAHQLADFTSMWNNNLQDTRLSMYPDPTGKVNK